MRGHIRRRGQKWAVVIDIGRDAKGRRRQRWHSGYPTRKAAESALTQLLGQLASDTYVAPTRLTLGSFLMDQWLPALRPSVRPNTFVMYETMATRQVVPAVGDVQLRQLTPARLNAYYGQLLESGRRTGNGGLKPKTVRNIHGLIRRALEDAVRWGYLARNPAALATPPRQPSPEIQPWSPAETSRFLQSTIGDRMHAAWRLVAMTGVRRGELTGLRWSNVDLAHARITIVRTLISANYELVDSEPKTAKGRRTIYIDTGTVAALVEHRRRQDSERKAAGEAWGETGLVFTREDGRVVHPELMSRWFRQAVTRSQLPCITIHGLRHSYATAGLASGVSSKVMSERLGHANAGITTSIYQHVLPEMDEKAAELVARLIDEAGRSLYGDERVTSSVSTNFLC